MLNGIIQPVTFRNRSFSPHGVTLFQIIWVITSHCKVSTAPYANRTLVFKTHWTAFQSSHPILNMHKLCMKSSPILDLLLPQSLLGNHIVLLNSIFLIWIRFPVFIVICIIFFPPKRQCLFVLNTFTGLQVIVQNVKWFLQIISMLSNHMLMILRDIFCDKILGSA